MDRVRGGERDGQPVVPEHGTGDIERLEPIVRPEAGVDVKAVIVGARLVERLSAGGETAGAARDTAVPARAAAPVRAIVLPVRAVVAGGDVGVGAEGVDAAAGGVVDGKGGDVPPAGGRALGGRATLPCAPDGTIGGGGADVRRRAAATANSSWRSHRVDRRGRGCGVGGIALGNGQPSRRESRLRLRQAQLGGSQAGAQCVERCRAGVVHA